VKRTRALRCYSGEPSKPPWLPFFDREDAAAVLFREWSSCKLQHRQYSKYDSWDRMLQQGIHAVGFLSGMTGIRIRQPSATSKSNSFCNRRTKRVRGLHRCNRRTRRQRCLLEWEKPLPAASQRNGGCWRLGRASLLFLDYRHRRGGAGMFVRKRLVEIQYFRTVYQQRTTRGFGHLGPGFDPEDRIAEFLPHRGSASLRTAPAVPTLGLVWEGKIWPKRVVRRPGAEDLVCLTSLHTRIRPMLPKLNRDEPCSCSPRLTRS